MNLDDFKNDFQNYVEQDKQLHREFDDIKQILQSKAQGGLQRLHKSMLVEIVLTLFLTVGLGIYTILNKTHAMGVMWGVLSVILLTAVVVYYMLFKSVRQGQLEVNLDLKTSLAKVISRFEFFIKSYYAACILISLVIVVMYYNDIVSKMGLGMFTIYTVLSVGAYVTLVHFYLKTLYTRHLVTLKGVYKELEEK